MKISDLVQKIKTANEAYYNTDHPNMTDAEYDKLIEELKSRKPDHPLLKQVGAPIKRNKVELPLWLGSMDKVKTEKELISWVGKNKSEEYIISDKLDGISALYNDNHLYTRGDGKFGQDISHLIPILGLPKLLTGTYAVRGEIILPKGVISRARNVVSGIVNSKNKEIDPNLKKCLRFVAYEQIQIQNIIQSNPEAQLKILKGAGFETVEHKQMDVVDFISMQTYLEHRKHKGTYEMDGLIIQSKQQYTRNSSGNPAYAVAFKVNLNSQQTKVIEVEWNVSKDGKLIPRVKYEPIDWEGVILQYANGHNARFIEENKIGPGSIIEVIRSGDVIPYISGVIHSTEPSFPENYVWDENHVNIMTTDISSTLTKELTHFLKKIGVKHVDERTVERMVKAGINSVSLILNVSVHKLMIVEGFEERKAQLVYDQINSLKRELTLESLLVASNQFKGGIGERKIKSLLKVWPDLYSSWRKGEVSIELIKQIDGFSDITATQVMEGLSNFSHWIKKNKIEYTSSVEEKLIHKQANQFFTGKKFVFSGFRDKELEEKIISQGGEIVSTISKQVNVLVVKDVSQSTTKIEKAMQYGISIMSRDEIDNLLLK